MGSFFGGKSKSKTDSHSTQTTTPWDKAVPGLDMLLGNIGDSLNNPPEYYPGQTYLNLNGKQNTGLKNIWNAASTATGNIVNPAMDAFHELLGGPDQNRWDDALGYYSDRAKQNLDRTVLPGINDSAIMAGGRTSSRTGIAEGVARTDASRDILGYNNDLAMNFEQLKQSGLEAGMSIAPNLFNLSLAPGNAQYETATSMRADEANKLNEDITRYNYNRDAPLQNMQQMYSMLFQMAQGFGTTTADSHTETVSKQQSPIFDKLLGAGMMAAGIMNPAAFSGGGFNSLSSMFGNGGASGAGIGMMNVGVNPLKTNLYFDPMNARGVGY
jgi:hypothetical protein